MCSNYVGLLNKAFVFVYNSCYFKQMYSDVQNAKKILSIIYKVKNVINYISFIDKAKSSCNFERCINNTRWSL